MRLLIIEDDDSDFLLIEHALNNEFALSRSSTLASGLAMAAHEAFDLIILDLALDDSQGYSTFEKAHAALAGLPILVLSDLENDELALRAVRNGAQDFIQKTRLLECDLARIARYAIERRLVEQAVQGVERQYRTLFDNLPTAAYSCDRDGTITYYNQRAVEMWGRAPKKDDPAERFCGTFRLFTADGTPIAPENDWVARSLREGKRFEGHEIVLELPDGSRRTVLGHVNPFFDESHTVTGAVNVIVDITSQRRAERQLYESERFARATVNSLAAHIAILDEHGKIIAVNTAWERFARENGTIAAGHEQPETNYLEVCERAVGDDASVAHAAGDGIRAVIRGEKSIFEVEYPCHTSNEERWFEMRATPFDGEGPTRVVVSHENITSRKVSERLAREQFVLRDAVAGMEQVLGVVGHELRTPLAALRAITEFLLTDGADPLQASRFLKEMSDEVDRMSDTVNNLLEAARLNSGVANWNWSEFEVCEIVEDALASIRPLTSSGAVALSARFDTAVGTMLGDADAIRRLLVNLLSNACKHTTIGRIEIVVRCHRDKDRNWIEFAVVDTGCGIPPHVTARLGEAFALNSGVVGNNYVGGTGLGLAICKGITAAHAGELTIKSVEGQGTTVTARLRADLIVATCGNTVQAPLSLECAA